MLVIYSLSNTFLKKASTTACLSILPKEKRLVLVREMLQTSQYILSDPMISLRCTNKVILATGSGCTPSQTTVLIFTLEILAQSKKRIDPMPRGKVSTIR